MQQTFFLKRWVYDLSGLFFPVLCEACDDILIPGEETFCTSCLGTLPRTGFHRYKDNPVAKQFWGKIPVEEAGACWHFTKGSRVQRLMHRFKYEKKPEIGVKAGTIYGEELKKAGAFADTDIVIPVPLHSGKLKIRGYNQAQCIAEGLGAVLGITCGTDFLYRAKFTNTQTKKNRFDRFLNVGEAFAVRRNRELEGRHVLLVDDVVTTGSTLVSCAMALLAIPSVKISIAALAFAER